MRRGAVRIVAMLAILLIAGNMRCLSACAVHPCDSPGNDSQPADKGGVPNCHHKNHTSPSPEHTQTQPCSHQPLLAKTGPQIVAPVFSISDFPLVAAAVEFVGMPASAQEAILERGPTPVLPSAASPSVLRI